ncbi:MAG TPA: hypothetical protein VLV78_14985 [Thermoanaerobaculia bacterium]|nr:hypothetical protein [Thermoanaerobaculia bacterium]
MTPAQYGRLIGTILLCGIGLWFAVTGHSKFILGGDPDSPTYKKNPIYVDAHGLDAAAIGCFFISLGIINLSLGVRGPKRIPVFWAGAGLMIATFLYGIAQAVMAVVALVTGK